MIIVLILLLTMGGRLLWTALGQSEAGFISASIESINVFFEYTHFNHGPHANLLPAISYIQHVDSLAP